MITRQELKAYMFHEHYKSPPQTLRDLMTNTTVADELAFAALPEEVQALAKRVLCMTPKDVEEAYTEGYNTGYSEGLSESESDYDSGYENGYDEGLTDGRNQSKNP